jgi:myo-inositol-1(or 4)-monophosphatase
VTQLDLNALQNLAADTAHAAGRLLLEYSQRIDYSTVDHKSSPVDLVSSADRAAEDLVRRSLLRATPDFGFIGEESAAEDPAGDSELYWVVDPLDGTSNYLCGLPIWSVSIALCQRCAADFEPLAAAISAPPLRKLWTAVSGAGALLNGRPIHVRREPAGGGLPNAMIATGFPYSINERDASSNLDNFRRMQRRYHKIRRLGSAAIDLAFVADGTYDGMWELGLKIWDISAGRLLITEAGGEFEMVTGPRSQLVVHILAAARSDLMTDMRRTLAFPAAS